MSGVATTIRNELDKNTLAMHCHGHALILACSNSINNSKLMQSALGTFFKIFKLVKNDLNANCNWWISIQKDCLLKMTNKTKQKLSEFLVIHDRQ